MKKMGATATPLFKDHYSISIISLTKTLLPWTFFALFSIAFVRLYFYPFLPFTTTPSPKTDDFSHSSYPFLHASLPSSSPSPLSSEKEKVYEEKSCDYSNGKWVRDKRGPLYNDTNCGMMKEGRNCITHGRPDSEYLYWRWKPSECNLPTFDPNIFLQLVRNKHIAFVGDSLARNQLESLLCMISTISTPKVVHQNGDGQGKFGQWHFASHNSTISLYWSPFLVQCVEKSSTRPNNLLYLERVDEKWARHMDQLDTIVLSIGHWFLLPAIYYENGSILGCHYCPGLNHTEIGFYDVLRKALRTTFNSIIERKLRGKGKNGIIDVVVTTFSPHHFEGDWDKAGACPKTMPYEKGEKKLEGMDAEMRKIEIEEVEIANNKAKSEFNEFGRLIRLEALDVTELALLRPDGHPGPYMNPFPFASGVQEHVQNDCVHWCLPGPIDTWNEILMQIMRKWEK
ncbi:hypothetical protein HN51_007319 [Arachis hypogaea]|uniref:Uncharacterized protein n=2 Tax=Arachis TaxID=3817 RepID=A0A445D8I9_ARAHY|nr:xyloglucan O-acetyltransferase 1 [Arachis duranensis]XP_025699384.1 protein ALTERED XYLOGLUCAN 4 [Arachis hypogaea]QHO41406.1 Protein ALTERED XYLOGLUCAN [Arachis hypogaea]RYR59484.1 hypothetical protein Ahy_A05g025376 [Arachis hypogaea]